MIPPITLTANTRARDVVLNDSCNCCCFASKRPNCMRNVYISESGIVYPFDPKKADDEREALKRTISNLQRVIADLSMKNAMDNEKVMRHISQHIVHLDPVVPPLITYDMVSRIIGYVNSPPKRKSLI